MHGGGTLRAPGTGQAKPAYTLEGQFVKLSPELVGQLLGLKWAGPSFDAEGRIDLAGFTDKDLADSVKGALHFEWQHGSMGGSGGVPAALARFDRWTADAEIANGTVTLKENEVRLGMRKRAVAAALTLGDPPKVAFSMPNEGTAKRKGAAGR